MISSANDTAPVAYWGRAPVYGVTWLVVVHCAAFCILAILIPLGFGWIGEALSFSSAEVMGRFAIWQIFTYAFVHPPSLWFLIEMAMLYFFGTEVEKFLGRRAFFTMYALLILLPPLLLTATGLFGTVSVLQGASAVNFAVFAAFAAILPDVRFFFGISAKWLAVVFFAFNSLVLFSGSAWSQLSALWLDTAAMLLFLRACGVRSLQFGIPKIGRLSSAIGGNSPGAGKFTRKLAGKFAQPSREAGDPMKIIDPILEKIARDGIASLSDAERKQLEKARSELLKRGRSGAESSDSRR